VNSAGITFVDGLFSKNERIIALLRPDQRPDGLVAMIAVGATMVGKVRVVFDDLTTNTRAGGASVARSYDPPKRLEKGAQWGNFEFGSTIVILATPGMIEPRVEEPGTRLVLGTRVASFK
jgi:phosphatidylserine decarboxylase